MYCKKSLHSQLYAHYGYIVSITSKTNKSLIVTLKSNVKQLIQEVHSRIMNNTEMDTLNEVVGNCIRNEIKTAEKHKGVYPEASYIYEVSRA